MARLVIIRAFHPLPGHDQAAIDWLLQTEPVRRQAGQLSQYIMRGLVDHNEYMLVQIWQDRPAYERWRASPDRARLANERTQYMTDEPTRLYEICE